ncbi:uncharacterized protein LOC108227261 isoform X2 [Daucus carota subsp. sativus]|uniref:uncharacterized protein LOC108227261 isoform X2 n=1 Tax=Daucus carota subsp. sativus TaxID=79200 RepID=UPI0030832A1F
MWGFYTCCSGDSASMLEISRKGKQLKKAACGTCGGKPLVDGIESESASMLSTVDLELSSFINPDLTWKKVKKGCRTTTRRSRKLVDQKSNVGAKSGNKSSERDQDSSVTESEKLGVAVLGRRFAEKVVDVPIKKRRFSVRPPSPPPRTPSLDHEGSLSPQLQTPSPHSIESEQLVDTRTSAAGIDNDDDFSGIELLAAAACGSSIDNDVKLETFAVKESAKADAVGFHDAAIPLKESIASSGASHFSDKDLVNEDDMGESAVNEIAAVSKNENGGVVRNRAHWDLNTVMEAWEEPDDVTPDNSLINCSEIAPGGIHFEKLNVENSLVQSNEKDVLGHTERLEQSGMCKVVPSNVESNKELADDTELAAIRSCFKEDASKTCSSLEGTCAEKQYVTTSERLQEASNFAVHATITSIPVTTTEALGNHLFTKSQHTARIDVSEEKMHAFNSEIEQVGEVSCGTSVDKNKKLLSGCSQVVKLEISTPNLMPPNNIGHAIVDTQIKDCNAFENTHGSPNSKTSPRQVISTVTYKTSDVNFTGELDRACQFHPSPKGEALSASSTSVVVGEVKLQADKAPAAENDASDVALQHGPMNLFDKSDNFPIKIDQNHNVGDYYDSYGKDGKQVNLDHVSEYEAGYDSSFEDGELREPGVYTWEENDMEGETEYVDYGSEYGDGDDFNTVNSKSANADNGQDGYQTSRKGTLLGKNDEIDKGGTGRNRSGVTGDSVKSFDQCFSGGALNGNHSACMKTEIGGDQFNAHLEYRVAVADGKVAGFDDKGLYGEFGPRDFRGKLSSFSKGPSPYDALERKTSLDVHRNRFDNSNYSYSRGERNFGPEKSMGRGRFSMKPLGSRNDTDGRWVDSPSSYRDTRTRYPHSYRGPDSHAYSRPRDSNATSGTKIGGFKRDDGRRPINYSSNNGPYRTFMGRRSPAEGEDSYFGRHGSPPVRDIGQDRSRGRSGRYVQGIRRVPRDDYNEDVPDDASLRPPRRQPYFSRRERGFSPNYGSGQFFRSRRNSCSRSRTRSPVAWNSQRERNMNTRRHSPDFRSDARMERIRPAFPKTSYGADNDELYVSPPRTRVSPNSKPRWLNDGNYMDDHFRDRRSPVRLFRQRSQRLESVGYSGRKSDGIFQPNVRRGRFQQVSSTGRGLDLEGSDIEKSKPDDRHEINHRVRRYDASGAVRRFRYDADNGFEARDGHKDGFRRTIKRDSPKDGAGEERGPRYNSNMMYASGSCAGQRDFNEDAAIGEE